jgi:hypothetical protein
MQSILHDFSQELIGLNGGKLFCEPNHDCLFDTEHSKGLDLLIECLQKRWS